MRRNAIAIGIAAALLSAAAWAHWGGGYGPGAGMMGYGGYGGYGMGPGMMGYGGYGPGYCLGDTDDLAGLGLTAEQRDKIAAIQREAWSKQRQSAIDRSQEARKRIESVLTEEQKRKLATGD